MPRDAAAPSENGPGTTDANNPAPAVPHAEVRERVAATARAAEHTPGFPKAYLAEVRSCAASFAAPESDPNDIRGVVAVLQEHALADATVPVRSANPAKRAAKEVVRKAVLFQSEYFAGQLSAVAWDTVWLGNAAALRIEALERQVAQLQARLDEIDQRPSAPDGQ